MAGLGKTSRLGVLGNELGRGMSGGFDSCSDDGGRMGGVFDFCSDADELKVLTPTIDGDEKGWEAEGEGDDADDLTKLTMERVEVENDEAVLSA